MDILQSVLLAVVQGITEFIPISSSAHLVIASKLFNFEVQNIAFDIVLHVATLLAVIVYFARDIVRFASACIFRSECEEREYAYAIIFGTLPIIVVGFFAYQNIDIFRTPFIISIALIISGVALIIADYAAKKGLVKEVPMLQRGFGVGLFQVLALIPGVSRSGITIAAGRAFGFSRKEAIKFSFMLSIPTIFAALILVIISAEWTDIVVSLSDVYVLIFSGMIAFVVAYSVIYIFLKLVDRIGFVPFCAYQIFLGLFLLFFV